MRRVTWPANERRTGPIDRFRAAPAVRDGGGFRAGENFRARVEGLADGDGQWALSVAAPQVGVSLRIFVTNFQRLPRVVINPVVMWESPSGTSRLEGCLSFGGGKRTTYVRRPDRIKASWRTMAGDEQMAAFQGMEARIFMHEFDHLNGKCIFEP